MAEIPARSLADAPATLGVETREKRGPGRPTLYTDELAAEICERIAGGDTLTSICRDDPRMPDRRNVLRWMEAREEFRLAYARARAEQPHAFVDEFVDRARNATPENANAVRVTCDALKWIAGRLLPKVYGDRVEIMSRSAAAEDMTDDDLAAIVASRRGGFVAAEKEG